MSSDDTTSTAEDFNSLEVTDPGPRTETQGTVFGVGGVSATGSTERDREIGYSDGRGNPGPNFEAFGGITNEMGEPVGKVAQTPSQFAAALEATQGGGISIPSIQAASSNLAPGIFGDGLSDFQSGVRPDTGRRPMPFDTPANEMLEAAIGTTVGIPNVSRETIVDRGAFLSPGQLFPSVTIQSGIRDVEKGKSETERKLQNIRDQLNFGTGDPGNPTRNPINFGVTQQVVPTTTPTARPENVRQRFEDAVIQEALDDELVKTEQDLDRPVISEYALGGLDPMLGARTRSTIPTEEIDDLADTEFARPRETGTTATGTFDPEAENLMDSTFLGTTPYKEGTAVADIKLRDAPFDENLNLFGLQIPNLAGRALNFASEKLNDRLFDAIVKKGGQALRDSEGRIIGAMDPTNSFLMEGMPGLDAKGQMRGQIQEEQGDGGEQVRRAPPKAPTDPCPEGYQLIDGKCTPTGATDTGTGFMMFPADRTPPFRTGPFTPTTVATNPNIRGLNPVTFGLSNIFRR